MDGLVADVYAVAESVDSTAVWAVVGSSLLCAHALRKGSLSKSGATLAWFVGFFTIQAGARFWASLMFFFFSSSFFTKVGAQRKKRLEEGYATNSQRSAIQVFCNGAVGTIACMMLRSRNGDEQLCLDYARFPWDTVISAAFLGHYACCAGDTWASELGILSTQRPRLVTTLREVPPGTNGGVSLYGLAASAAGGLGVGLVMALAGAVTGANDPMCPSQWGLIPLGLAAGLFGSLLDSLLGATAQASFYDEEKRMVVSEPSKSTKHISGVDALDNHQVNFLSAFITALWTAYFAKYFF